LRLPEIAAGEHGIATVVRAQAARSCKAPMRYRPVRKRPREFCRPSLANGGAMSNTRPRPTGPSSTSMRRNGYVRLQIYQNSLRKIPGSALNDERPASPKNGIEIHPVGCRPNLRTMKAPR
jgi:hypothetical protein